MNLLIFSMFTLWSYCYGFALDCMHLHKCRCVCWCFCLCALVIRLVKNALPTSQLALAASSLTLAHYFAKLQSLLLLLLHPPPLLLLLLLLLASLPFFLLYWQFLQLLSVVVGTPCLGACLSCYFFSCVARLGCRGFSFLYSEGVVAAVRFSFRSRYLYTHFSLMNEICWRSFMLTVLMNFFPFVLYLILFYIFILANYPHALFELCNTC